MVVQVARIHGFDHCDDDDDDDDDGDDDDDDDDVETNIVTDSKMS